jgi:polysaccharide export outer membrane protein
VSIDKPRNAKIARRTALALLAGTSLSACAGGMTFPVSEEAQEPLAERGINVIRISTKNIEQYGDTKGAAILSVESNPPSDPGVYAYPVGVGDQLRVQTWSTPERRVSGDGDAIVEGPIVNERGQFFYPFVGMVTAVGRTTTQIRGILEQKLSVYIADPQVEVDVQEFNAHRVSVVGAVTNQGAVTLTNVPMRLLDLLNQAGTEPDSDLRRVEIRRHDKTYIVNLQSFVDYGARGQNPLILPGDMVVVPAMNDNKVFVFGEIETGEVLLGSAPRNLTEILAGQGGIDQVRANARGIFVFRRPPGRQKGFDVFQFDLTDASTLILTSQFMMAPMDVVFVTTDPIARWNDTVGQVASAVSAVVQGRALVDAFTP